MNKLVEIIKAKDHLIDYRNALITMAKPEIKEIDGEKVYMYTGKNADTLIKIDENLKELKKQYEKEVKERN